jgi:putative SOS response-associated peptidase YedK
MGLAAIWEAWRRPPAAGDARRPGPTDLDALSDDWVISLSLLTVNADQHEVMKRFHRREDEKRSVVILHENQFDNWLGANISTARDFLHTADPNVFLTSPAPQKPRKSRAKQPPTPTRKLL